MTFKGFINKRRRMTIRREENVDPINLKRINNIFEKEQTLKYLMPPVTTNIEVSVK